jgi:hypothetical protein
MRVGQSRKRDGNEAAIVRALRQISVDVWRISAPGLPDLITHFRGRWLPIEVKHKRARRSLSDHKGRSLTPAQCATYRIAPFPVVETVQEALELFGVRVTLSSPPEAHE